MESEGLCGRRYTGQGQDIELKLHAEYLFSHIDPNGFTQMEVIRLSKTCVSNGFNDAPVNAKKTKCKSV